MSKELVGLPGNMQKLIYILITVFDEDFVFEVRAATLGRHILEILLYDFDAYSRHHSIGGVQFPLCNIDLSDKVDLWKQLIPLSDKDSRVDLGELMVSLAYLPSAERLTVVIIKARNLRIVDDTRNSSGNFLITLIINVLLKYLHFCRSVRESKSNSRHETYEKT